MTSGNPARALVPGVVAGLIGGALLDAACSVVLGIAGGPNAVVRLHQFAAAGAIGRGAYADPRAAWLGAAVHATVSAAWGAGYAWVAVRTPQVRREPLVSGAAFGVVVFVAMSLVRIAAAVYTLPLPSEASAEVLAHVACFGIPVALVVSRALGRA